MSEMKNKVVIITGASSGIGKASALKFAEEGASIVLVARNKERLEKVAQDIQKIGSKALVLPTDLSKETEVEKVAIKAVEEFGGIDVLVNAAGIIGTGTVETTKLSEWDQMMNINLRSPFHLMQCTLPSLIERKGNIVNVSSVTGPRAFPGVLAYCVSKAGMDQLTHCTALELADKGVRVNAVNPGVIVSELHRRAGMNDQAYATFLEHSKTTHPLGRVGNPEEVAELIYFLASPRAKFITGIVCPIDGGRAQTCAR